MTTSHTTGTMAHSDDATFRTWGSALSAHLSAIGLVQTSDTGQINWATVLRPGTNTAAGYEIWRFDDALQSTAPIYLKVEYGTANVATTPGIWLTVGIGTDGAGTVNSPTKTTRTTCQVNASIIAGTLDRHACHREGAAWIVFHASTTASQIAFAVFRSCDDSGEPTSEGCVVYTRGLSSATPPSVQALRFSSPATVFAQDITGLYTLIPHAITDSHVGIDIQFFLHWMPCPRVRPVFGIADYINTELTRGTSIDHILVGPTNRTFMPLGGPASLGGLTSYGHMLIWE